jgi:putative phosphoesterase
VRIGLISDTHGHLDPRVPELFAGVDLILHGGDVGHPRILHELDQIAPVTAVLGNNDAGLVLRETEVLTVVGQRWLMHHIVNPGNLSEHLRRRVAQEKPAVLVFGHTHIAFDGVVNGVRFVNPGYSGKPRFDQARSVAVMERVAAEWRVTFLPLADKP